MGSRRALLLDATVPVTAVGTVMGAAYYHDMDTPTPGATALSVAACVALAGRRRFPAATVAITALLAIAVLATDREMAPYALLVPAVALFSLALLGSRARQVAGGVGCVAVTVLAQLLNRHRPGLLISAQHLIQMVGVILAIEVSRTRRAYRSEVGRRVALDELTREQEAQRRVSDERLRIARDLHDVIAHTLTTINVQAAVAGHLLDSRPEQARHALSVIEEASRDGIGELRAILGILRDPHSVAARAPTPGLDQLPDLVEQARTAGLRAQLDVTGQAPARVPEAVSLAAYRIVQESLTNIARHTHDAGIQVRLSYAEGELGIAVENTVHRTRRVDGADVPRPVLAFGGDSPRVGILGMTERAEALGGTLTTTASETGFLVHARLPYRAG